MDRHGLLVVAAAMVLLFAACAPVSKTTPGTASPLGTAGPHASRLLASLTQQEELLGSFRGIGKVTIRGKGRPQTNRVAWIGSRPQRLRVEVLGAMGQSILTFLLHGSTFYLQTHQDNRCLTGRATARNMSRFVSIPVRAEVLFSVLAGQPPLLPFTSAKAQPLKGEGNWRLSLYGKWRRPVERIWFTDDGTTPERVEFFDAWRNVEYSVKFSQFEDTEGFRVPHEIVISHVQGMVLSLSVERFWRNVAVPSGAYSLELADVEIVELDRPAPPPREALP